MAGDATRRSRMKESLDLQNCPLLRDRASAGWSGSRRARGRQSQRRLRRRIDEARRKKTERKELQEHRQEERSARGREHRHCGDGLREVDELLPLLSLFCGGECVARARLGEELRELAG